MSSSLAPDEPGEIYGTGEEDRVSQDGLTRMNADPTESFDVFLCHAHNDAEIVERLGVKITDEVHLRVWLDKWILVPGEHWQQEMAKGLEQAKTCAVCVSQETPHGWFREEIERALNRQAKDHTFRVIPIILPNGDRTVIDNFLELRTWVDFQAGIDDGYAFHVLISGIRGRAPGRYVAHKVTDTLALETIRGKLRRIRTLREEQLIDDNVALEYQRRVLDEIIEP